MIKQIFCALVGCVSVELFAITVSIDSVRQRYPWNGMVDVGYTIEGVEANHAYSLEFGVRHAGEERPIVMDSAPHTVKGFDWWFTNGSFTAAFNLAETNLFPDAVGVNCRLFAKLVDNGELQFPGDALADPVGIVADVMIVDVSSGSSSATYPVEYWDGVDTGRFNCDTYKLNKIVLRKIPADSYRIGHSTASDRTVTTRGYYISLFEVTQKHYRNVVGSIPSGQNNTADMYPVSAISWNMIRGSVAVTAKPTGAFMANLEAKAKRTDGTSVTGWDLPTDAQWEIAARAGCTYQWLSSSSSGIVNWGWIDANSSGRYHVVGEKPQNAFGLYDVQGNIWTWTRDAYVSTLTLTDADTPYTSGSSRIIRGGGYRTPSSNYSGLALSNRYSYSASNNATDLGIRLFCP